MFDVYMFFVFFLHFQGMRDFSRAVMCGFRFLAFRGWRILWGRGQVRENLKFSFGLPM